MPMIPQTVGHDTSSAKPGGGGTTDVVVATILAVVFAPLFLVIALWVLLESRGPMMVRRAVALPGGQMAYATEFRLWRMYAEPAGASPRRRPDTVIGSLLSLTRTGRLPRLLDVRAGRMSLETAWLG